MSGTLGRILIVDDDHDVLVAARLLLKRHFPFIGTETDPGRIPAVFAEDPPDVVLLDMNFAMGENSGREGLEWLSQILGLDPDTVVILITAYGDVSTAVEAMKRGAADFVVKPWQNDKLVETVRNAMTLRQSRRDGRGVCASGVAPPVTMPPLPPDARSSAIIGDCDAMRGVWDVIERAAPTEANVLIVGENGTGKELVAREIHRLSPRAAQTFLPVDVGEITESLFESEMFGHKKGAFTGAKDDRIGRFQAAESGTLFLDEIGNLPLHLQAKLLSVLERREVRPVGGDKAVPVDVRLICATNVPTAQLMKEDVFRQDLLYRVNTVEIRLPPLRERLSDIPALVETFEDHFAHKYNLAPKRMSRAALDRLTAYHWPGNIRELRHAVERATIMSRGVEFEADDFPLAAEAPGADAACAGGQGDLALGTYNLDSVEKAVIERALRKNDGNVSRTARELGITRASLYRRMEKYGL